LLRETENAIRALREWQEALVDYRIETEQW
jgi:hypothetical protein